VCQALDLRVIDISFQVALEESIPNLVDIHLGGVVQPEHISRLSQRIAQTVFNRLENNGSMDTVARYSDAFSSASSTVIDFLGREPGARANTYDDPIVAITKWREASTQLAVSLIRSTRDSYRHGSAAQYMGRTRALYEWVRGDLGISLRKGDVHLGGSREPTIGTSVSKIYAGLRSGQAEGILALLAQP
jgi:phenylalanine ammonia-lyase